MFANQTRENGKVFFKKGLTLNNLNSLVQTYSVQENADYMAVDIQIKDGFFYFTINGPDSFNIHVKLGVPGLHNVENALVAAAVAVSMGVEPKIIKKALESFSGVVRRFDYRIKKENLIYIDDYAHHPSELSACIDSVKKMYAGKKITGIFQPHLYSRTRDFANGFAKSLENLDQIILVDLYPAREEPIEGVSSKIIFDKIENKNKKLCSRQEIVPLLNADNSDIILTLGAGDIDKEVEPIKEFLKRKYDI